LTVSADGGVANDPSAGKAIASTLGRRPWIAEGQQTKHGRHLLVPG
jgi:hypothetical protein